MREIASRRGTPPVLSTNPGALSAETLIFSQNLAFLVICFNAAGEYRPGFGVETISASGSSGLSASRRRPKPRRSTRLRLSGRRRIYPFGSPAPSRFVTYGTRTALGEAARRIANSTGHGEASAEQVNANQKMSIVGVPVIRDWKPGAGCRGNADTAAFQPSLDRSLQATAEGLIHFAAFFLIPRRLQRDEHLVACIGLLWGLPSCRYIGKAKASSTSTSYAKCRATPTPAFPLVTDSRF